MDLNLKIRELDENGKYIELTGSISMIEVIVHTLTPKVRSIIRRWRERSPMDCDKSNAQITNFIIESSNDRDAHCLMLYTELIDHFDLPDKAAVNEGY
jgi:hypothetical protein